MKQRDEKLERLERALREAHRARPAREPDETWRRTLMADIRARAAGPAQTVAEDVSATLRSVVRLAPVFAAAAAIIFVCGWVSFYGTYDEMALTMLTGATGSTELSAMGF